MKRSLTVLASGLLAGIVAHLGWYQAHRPCRGDELACQLAWIRSELKLSDEQYERVRTIHEESGPRLLALATQVAQMKDEYAAFERERVTVGRVDFLEFARFVEQRRAIDRECLALTRRLVAATSLTMNAAQRERYLGLISPAANDVSAPLPQ